jgi:hypothetical protein
MTRITIDDSLRERLQSEHDCVQLCDEEGKTIGHFLPSEVYARMIFDKGNARISDEELEKRLNEPGARPLKGFLDGLEK